MAAAVCVVLTVNCQLSQFVHIIGQLIIVISSDDDDDTMRG